MKDQNIALSPPCADTARSWLSVTREDDLIESRPCCTLISDSEIPSLWCSVTTPSTGPTPITSDIWTNSFLFPGKRLIKCLTRFHLIFLCSGPQEEAQLTDSVRRASGSVQPCKDLPFTACLEPQTAMVPTEVITLRLLSFLFQTLVSMRKGAQAEAATSRSSWTSSSPF